MRENLDVFSWQLSDNDMHALSHSASTLTPRSCSSRPSDCRLAVAVPQCNITRGSPFMDGDREAHSHKNMIGPTLHC